MVPAAEEFTFWWGKKGKYTIQHDLQSCVSSGGRGKELEEEGERVIGVL